MLRINEIFFSIQGEGIQQGLPTIFIRLTGCNLNCSYCDTKYAFTEGLGKDTKAIVEAVKKFNCKRVCITGGEPLLQKEVKELIDNLHGYDISIETNGTLDISKYNEKANISLDIKCPSSGCGDRNMLSNLDLLTLKDQVKFVVKDETDLSFAKRIIEDYKLVGKTNVLINPVFGADCVMIVDYILNNNLDVRFGMQIHKFIWNQDVRGV